MTIAAQHVRRPKKRPRFTASPADLKIVEQFSAFVTRADGLYSPGDIRAWFDADMSRVCPDVCSRAEYIIVDGEITAAPDSI